MKISFFNQVGREVGFNVGLQQSSGLLPSVWDSSVRLVGCRLKANCPLMEPGPVGGVPSVGGLSKGS